MEDIKNMGIKSLPKQPHEYLEKTFEILLNRIDNFENEVQSLKEINKKLMDEINRLKGEKGRPDIRPNKDNDKEKKGGAPGDRGRPTKKKTDVKIHTKKDITPEKSSLRWPPFPEDAEYKGGRKVIIQDINFSLDNIEFT